MHMMHRVDEVAVVPMLALHSEEAKNIRYRCFSDSNGGPGHCSRGVSSSRAILLGCRAHDPVVVWIRASLAIAFGKTFVAYALAVLFLCRFRNNKKLDAIAAGLNS